MYNFISILAVLLPIAALIIIPIWLKKRGKGKNTFVRILLGIAGAFVLMMLMGIVLSSIDKGGKKSSTKDTESSAKIKQNEDESETEVVKYPKHPKFEQFAYYKRDKEGDFNYRIFVFLTDASPEDMEKHAKKQMWSNHGTTMVCYFRSSEGLNSDAITYAKNVDKAIEQIWKPSLVGRYMHWPTGKEEFTENPCQIAEEDTQNDGSNKVDVGKKSAWIESTSIDEMTDATTIWMTLTSDNHFDLGFPYNGGTRLTITVRYRKQDGNHVMLSVNRGQLLASTYSGGNNVVIRFDDDAAMTFSTTEPADYSSDMLFLKNPKKFINRAKTAKIIKVQVPLYDNGNQVFIFKPAEPLKWNK